MLRLTSTIMCLAGSVLCYISSYSNMTSATLSLKIYLSQTSDLQQSISHLFGTHVCQRSKSKCEHMAATAMCRHFYPLNCLCSVFYWPVQCHIFYSQNENLLIYMVNIKYAAKDHYSPRMFSNKSESLSNTECSVDSLCPIPSSLIYCFQ